MLVLRQKLLQSVLLQIPTGSRVQERDGGLETPNLRGLLGQVQERNDEPRVPKTADGVHPLERPAGF